jgi:hypothetical protein
MLYDVVPPFSKQEMESAAGLLETLVVMFQITRCHNAGCHNLNLHHYKRLVS